MSNKRYSATQEETAKKPRRSDSFEEYKNEYIRTTPWRGSVNAKLNGAAPYYFFLTRVKDSYATYDEDLSITFPGKIKDEFHHCYHVSWLREF